MTPPIFPPLPTIILTGGWGTEQGNLKCSQNRGVPWNIDHHKPNNYTISLCRCHSHLLQRTQTCCKSAFKNYFTLSINNRNANKYTKIRPLLLRIGNGGRISLQKTLSIHASRLHSWSKISWFSHKTKQLSQKWLEMAHLQIGEKIFRMELYMALKSRKTHTNKSSVISHPNLLDFVGLDTKRNSRKDQENLIPFHLFRL